MWNDIKKFGSSILEQTKDQKELILFNLRAKSLSEKQEVAFARLGSFVYTPLKDGNSLSPDEEELKNLISEIGGIEKEVEETALMIKKLKTDSASERDQMLDDMEAAWNKTRSTFNELVRDDEKETENAGIDAVSVKKEATEETVEEIKTDTK